MNVNQFSSVARRVLMSGDREATRLFLDHVHLRTRQSDIAAFLAGQPSPLDSLNAIEEVVRAENSAFNRRETLLRQVDNALHANLDRPRLFPSSGGQENVNIWLNCLFCDFYIIPVQRLFVLEDGDVEHIASLFLDTKRLTFVHHPQANHRSDLVARFYCPVCGTSLGSAAFFSVSDVQNIYFGGLFKEDKVVIRPEGDLSKHIPIKKWKEVCPKRKLKVDSEYIIEVDSDIWERKRRGKK